MSSIINASTSGGGGIIQTADASGILELQSGGVTKFTLNSSGVSYSGALVQQVYTQTGAVATGTTQTPYDDTIPQITEGNEFMTRTITPKSATNILFIECSAFVSANPAAGYTITPALHQDAVAGALAAMPYYSTSDNGIAPLYLGHLMVAGGTSLITFRYRVGINAAATTTFNGQSAGSRRMGSVLSSFIRVTEIAV